MQTWFQPLAIALPDNPDTVTPTRAIDTSVGEAPATLGCRNDTLFKEVLKAAHRCTTIAGALMVARTINDGFSPPLSDLEVVRTAQSAWKMHRDGRNWNGCEPHMSFPKSLWSAFDEKPDALLLFKIEAAGLYDGLLACKASPLHSHERT